MTASPTVLATISRSQFADFFAAVRHGQRPFAWQERLLDHLLDHGSWPERISAPTGSGKTAVIDVHVFATALSAAGCAPRLPRRLSLVVNRRMVVDSHAEHAQRIADALGGVDVEATPVLHAVAHWLNTLVAHDDEPRLDAPLLTTVLRGGIPQDTEWRIEPERCSILTCTPDMWGSRLLLRGYGTSLRARPQEAGLLALDNVVVVDEAHLSRQLLRTAGDVRRFALPDAQLLGVPALQVVDTTATPDVTASPSSVVGVGVGDLGPESPLPPRLTRPKPVRLHPLDGWPAKPTAASRSDLALAVAAEVAAMLDATRSMSAVAGAVHTVGCVLNRVDDAAAVAEALRHTHHLRVALLTGRMRPADRDLLRQAHPGLLEISGSDDVDVLVATQTIEVGVDVDLAGLVTDLAPGTALVQRAGRVNRLGLRDDGPLVVLVPEAPLDEAKPLIGSPYAAADLNRAREWLVGLASTTDGMTPWALAQPTAAIPAERRRRDTYQPLAWWDAELLARTSDHGHAEPDLALWLADDLADPRSCSVVFRTLSGPGLTPSEEELVGMLRATRPREHEVVELRVGAMLGLLERYLAAGEQWHRAAPVLRYKGSDPEAEDAVISMATVHDDRVRDPQDVLPLLRDGDVVVLDSTLIRAASLATTTWRAQGTDVERATVDVFEHRSPGRPAGSALRLGHLSPQDSDAYLQVVDQYLLGLATADPGDDDQIKATLGVQLRELSTAPGEPPSELLVEFADLLGSEPDSVEVSCSALDDEGHPEGVRFLVITDHRRPVAGDPLLSTAGRSRPVLLADHQEDVGRRARRSAEQLGLPASLVAALGIAGDHHDDGKAEPRFQLGALGNERPAERTLAKSGRRSPSGQRLTRHELTARTGSGALPRGWRHEQLSVLAVHTLADPPSDVDLVARLVGTSHGAGRPLFPHGSRDLLGTEPGTTAVELFDHGGWEELMSTTQRRYGVWGCAYLEALLRAADVRVSREGR